MPGKMKDKSLEDFFRKSDLGPGRGGDLPRQLSGIITGIKDGSYPLIECGHSTQFYVCIEGLKKHKFTADEAREYISDPEFPNYVVKACQEIYPSDCHAPAFIYRALNNMRVDKMHGAVWKKSGEKGPADPKTIDESLEEER